MAFNPLQNYNQGFGVGQTRRDAEFQKSEEQRLKQQRESALNAGEQSDAFKKLIVEQPNFAFKLKESLGTDDQGLAAIVEDSAMLKYDLETDPSGKTAMARLLNRKEAIDNSFSGQGKNSFQTDRGISILQNEGPQALLKNLNAMLDIPNQLKGSSFRVQSAKILDDGTVIQVGSGGGIQVISSSGEALTGNAAKEAVKLSRDQSHKRKIELKKLDQNIKRTQAQEGLLTDQQKGIQRGNISRIGELSKTSTGRLAAVKKATKFKLALDKGEVHSGAGRIGASFIPGVFTEQAQFDEEFNAFAEVAARQQLKAAGETKPTDADVEGMKRAMFGIGRDEQVNITLLNDFINSQNKDTGELDQLIEANKNGTLSEFIFTSQQQKADEASIFSKYGIK